MELAKNRFNLGRWRFSPAMAVFAAALLVRLWVLVALVDTSEGLPNQGDMKFYSDWARRIAGGMLTDHQAFYGLPGYAYWLALVYKVAGYQPFLAAFFQVIAEACTATLIFRLAPLAFAREGDAVSERRAAGVGWAAALAWMVFVPAQAYSAVLMPTCYLVAAFWFVVWWVLRRRTERPAASHFFALGLMAGVVAMMVANILFLLPLVIAAIFVRRHWGGAAGQVFTRRARVLAAALLLAGAGLGILPCALHNYLLAGEPVLLSAHSGINAYIGNNPQATGYPYIPPPLRTDQQGMLKDSIVWAERAVGHPLRRVEVSKFWSGMARDFVHEHPGAWVRLEGTKLGNFWNGFEYDDLGVLTTMHEDGALIPGLHWGLAATLALPGLLLAAARRPRARWIIAAVGLHMASVLTVFVTERYRLAAAPGLLLIGCFGVMELRQEVAARRWLMVGAYALILAGAAVLVHWPVDERFRYLDEFNSAVADTEQGHYDRAQRKLEHVLSVSPTAETYFALGNVMLSKGNHDRAKSLYRETLRLDPRHDRVLNNLGVLALEEKRYPLAEAFLSSAVQIEPTDAKTHYLLAEARYEQHDLDGAHQALAEAMRLRPDEPMFLKLNDRMQLQKTAGTP